MRLHTSNRIALGICLSFVILAIGYAAITPAFEAPDEASHFLYAHNILREGRLPILEDRTTVFASQSTQRHHPPLYYLIGAGLIAWTSRTDIDSYLQPNPFAAIGVVSVNNQNTYLHPLQHAGDTAIAVWVMRLFSISLGAVTLWFVYRIGCLAFNRPSIGLLAMLFTASLPQFIFITASVNNDNLVTALYTIGIYYTVKLWQQQDITWRDTLIIGAVLAAIALSKLTGLSLFGVIYGVAVVGGIAKRFSWRMIFRLIATSLLMAGVVSGWWSVRNWQLYGDPLALHATLAIWGRGTAPISNSELYAIWESFWLVLGNFNIRGPNWFYVYANVITAVGVIGIGWLFTRSRTSRFMLGLLVAVSLLIVASVLVATRQINISQGRLLFPAIGAIACLLAAGWHTLVRRAGSVLLLSPLIVLALFVPTQVLRPAYMPLIGLDHLPDTAYPLAVTAETLRIVGYELTSETVTDHGAIRLRLYFSGTHKDNPRLYIKALEMGASAVVGTLDVYPGMAPTNTLPDADAIYRADINVQIDASQLQTPTQINLVIGWNTGGRYLPLMDGTQPLEALVISGPVWTNVPTPTPPTTPTDITFDDNITLVGYSLPEQPLHADTSFNVVLYWQCKQPITEELSAAVILLDVNKQVVAQADGIPSGYPPQVWRCGTAFTDTRTLNLPDTMPAGAYMLHIGWYKRGDGTRLLAREGDVAQPDNLYPITITVSQP